MTPIWASYGFMFATIGLLCVLAARNRRSGWRKTREAGPSELEYLAACLAEIAIDRPNVRNTQPSQGERQSREPGFGELVSPLGILN
jgi:hypothetical protein